MANYIDPAFQLGMMLGNAYGNMWAANAKKRQGAKADDIINEMKNQQEIERIANMRSAPAENAAQAVVNDVAQKQAAQAAGQITGLGNLGVNKGVDYMGMGAQFAEPQDPFKLSVPSAIDVLKSPLGKERALNNAMQATAKDYQQQASLTPAQRKSSNWNPNYTEDNVRNRLKQAGINKEVIDEKMGEVKSDIAQRARDVLVPSIMQNLYGTVDEQGNYKSPTPMDSMKAMIDLQTLAQYDPATAKMLSTGVISPKEYLNIQIAKDKAAQDFQNKLTLANVLEAAKTVRPTARPTASGGTSRGWKVNYSVSDTEYKTALEQNQKLDEQMRDPNYKPSQNDHDLYVFNTNVIRTYQMERSPQLYSYNKDTTAQTNNSLGQIDPDNWDSVNNAIDRMIKQGIAREKIKTDFLDKIYPNGGAYYDNFINSMGLGSKNQTKESEPPRKNSDRFVSDTASNERSGLAKAIQEGKGWKYITDTTWFPNW